MKKFLVLAFVSAAFLFGCSADGSFSGSSTPPPWKGGPSSTPSGGGGNPNPNPGNYNYCVVDDGYDCTCYPMGGTNNDVCTNIGGNLSNTCPSSCDIY